MAWKETLDGFNASPVAGEKKKFDPSFLSKYLEADGYSVAALILTLHLMKPGDDFVAPTGKLTKTGESTFTLSVDDSVVEKGVELVHGRDKTSVSEIFEREDG